MRLLIHSVPDLACTFHIYDRVSAAHPGSRHEVLRYASIDTVLRPFARTSFSRLGKRTPSDSIKACASRRFCAESRGRGQSGWRCRVFAYFSCSCYFSSFLLPFFLLHQQGKIKKNAEPPTRARGAHPKRTPNVGVEPTTARSQLGLKSRALYQLS